MLKLQLNNGESPNLVMARVLGTRIIWIPVSRQRFEIFPNVFTPISILIRNNVYKYCGEKNGKLKSISGK